MSQNVTVSSTVAGRTGIRWRVFGVIFVLVVINLVDRIALSIAMPTIAKEFALSPAVQGIVLSAFFWSYAVLQVPGGWLIDRFGPRAMVAGSTLLWGAFQALAAGATGGVSLILTRIGLGAAEAPLFPSGAKLAASWLSVRERGRGAVLMDCGGPLGAALGGLAISWLILSLGSWRLAFVVAGAATMAIGLLAWWFLRDDPRQHSGVNAAELAWIGDAGRPAEAAAHRPGPIAPRSLAGLLIGRMGWAMVFFGLITWGPNYLAQARGLDLKQLGYATFAIFLCGAAGSLVGGFASDALVARGLPRSVVVKSMLAASGAIAVCAFLLLPSVTDATTAVLLLSIAAFFLLWGSLYWSLPALLAPKERVGFVGSLMNCAGSVSGIAVPIVAGAILQSTGTYLAVLYFFAFCAGLYVVGTLLVDIGAAARERRGAV